MHSKVFGWWPMLSDKTLVDPQLIGYLFEWRYRYYRGNIIHWKCCALGATTSLRNLPTRQRLDAAGEATNTTEQ